MHSRRTHSALPSRYGRGAHGSAQSAELDGESAPMWYPIDVKAGQTLAVGRVTAGCRTYLAVRNGLDVPPYLGSRSTFVAGQVRRPRRTNVARRRYAAHRRSESACLHYASTREYAAGRAFAELIPVYSARWEISVLHGPHGAPDYFTHEAIEEFFQDGMGSALQLQSARGPIDRPQAVMVPRFRRRSGSAPFERA